MVARDDPYERDPYERDGPPRDGTDPRSDRPRRATRPTRPAWDAMTYGRPDDVRPPIRTSGYSSPYGPPAPEPPSRPGAASYDRPSPYDRAPSYDRPSYETPSSYEPASSYEAPSSYEPSYDRETDWSSRYGPPPTPGSVAPPTYPAAPYPAATSPASTYPASTLSSPTSPDPTNPRPTNPASAYPAATPTNPASLYPAATDTPLPTPESFAPETYTSYRASPTAAGPSLADAPEPVYVASGLSLDEPAPPSRQNGADAPDGRSPASPDASAYPGGVDEQPRDEPPPPKGGRNLPAAIGVGLGLGAVALGSLFIWRPAFLGLVVLGVSVGIWELVRALQRTGANPPLVPLIAGGLLMTGLAWWGGTEALTFGLVVTLVAVMVWRFAHGTAGYALDVTTASLIAVYVPFLGGFMAMLAQPEDGHLRVLATLIAVVLTDTGGYAVGVKFGRHAMAPAISPKKSWEGLGGSLAAAAVGSAIVLWVMFDVAVWWGLLFGLAVAFASVVGDLAESMVKRAIGIKDMSSLLPGHGGAMDRLDSILFAAPVGYIFLSFLVPVA
jgi:CDP-diglyceride synthetase